MSAKDTRRNFIGIQFVRFFRGAFFGDRGASARVIMAQNCGHPESSHGTKRHAWLQLPNVYLEKMATVSKLDQHSKKEGQLSKAWPGARRNPLLIFEKKMTRPGLAWNLRLRRPTPYPLGQQAKCIE